MVDGRNYGHGKPIGSLTSCGLAEGSLNPDHIWFFVTYFSVFKKLVTLDNGKVQAYDCTIINGKALSQLCRMPAKVHLPC